MAHNTVHGTAHDWSAFDHAHVDNSDYATLASSHNLPGGPQAFLAPAVPVAHSYRAATRLHTQTHVPVKRVASGVSMGGSGRPQQRSQGNFMTMSALQ